MDYEDEDGLSKLLNMDMSGLSFDGVDLSALEGMDLSGLNNLDLSGLLDVDMSGLSFEGLDPSMLEGVDTSLLESLGLSLPDGGGGGSDDVAVRGPVGGADEEKGLSFADSLDDMDTRMGDANSGVIVGDAEGGGEARSLTRSLSGDGQPDNPLYSDTTEEVQPWQNLEGSGTTQLSDAYSYKDGKWSVRGYYDEGTGRFIPDPNGPLTNPLDETSGTNLKSMDGYTYDKKTGTWTTPQGETYTPKTAPSHTAKSGAQVMVNAGALPSGYNGLTPEKRSTADTFRTGTSGKDSSGNKSSTGDKKNDLSYLLPLLLAMMAMNRGGGGSSSGAVIPSLSADRKQLPYGPSSGEVKRPGAGGTTYFSPTTYTKKAAGGGMMYGGGGISNLGGYSDGGRLLRGPGDGVSDSIPATIGGKQPARLATGEFVVPARIVSELGNGSTEAGAKKLYAMMDRVQKARRKTKNVAADTKAHKYLPA